MIRAQDPELCQDELALVEQAHAFELTSLCEDCLGFGSCPGEEPARLACGLHVGSCCRMEGVLGPGLPHFVLLQFSLLHETICEVETARWVQDAAFSAIERLSENTVVPLIKGLRTFYKA